MLDTFAQWDFLGQYLLVVPFPVGCDSLRLLLEMERVALALPNACWESLALE